MSLGTHTKKLVESAPSLSDLVINDVSDGGRAMGTGVPEADSVTANGTLPVGVKSSMR